MVDMEWSANMVTSNIPTKSPKLSNKNKLGVLIPPPFPFSDILSPTPSSSSACVAYDQYLRLPELKKLWSTREFINWENEPILKPALQALEITFRFISTVLSDPRPYANRREWTRRLESLTTNQVQLIAILCQDENEDPSTRGTAPIVDLSSSSGLLARNGSVAEVWKLPGEAPVVNYISETSLLPPLATWQKSEDVAQKILYSIECEMRRCPYTLGLGEPNLTGKPNLAYDAVCEPSKLHALKKDPNHVDNQENQTLFTTHQILESWIFASSELMKRIVSRIEKNEFERASSDCWLLERIWKLLSEIEDLHLLVDPDDFLKLKNQLAIKSESESDSLCFRSRGLIEVMRSSKDLRHKVPYILGVEVDPKGGPRVQEAAMKLYREKGSSDKISLLQALQAVESALKRFFFAYKQMLVVVMGSLEAKANRVAVSSGLCDSLSQIFMEPTYFPSLDAAKTFLGDYWNRHSECMD